MKNVRESVDFPWTNQSDMDMIQQTSNGPLQVCRVIWLEPSRRCASVRGSELRVQSERVFLLVVIVTLWSSQSGNKKTGEMTQTRMNPSFNSNLWLLSHSQSTLRKFHFLCFAKDVWNETAFSASQINLLAAFCKKLKKHTFCLG